MNLVQYPAGTFYAMQDKVWMDDHCMLDWVECIVHPYSELTDEYQPMLILDGYHCHMMGSVVRKNSDLGIII